MTYNKNGNDLLDVFDAFFTNMDNVWAIPNKTNIYSCQFPPLNVYINEETKDLKFEFALAGYSKDEIQLEFEGDYLRLKIIPKTPTIEEEKERSSLHILQHGIKRTSLEKKFYVPIAKYQVDKIKVSFENGVLTIEIPAKDEIKLKKIPIL